MDYEVNNEWLFATDDGATGVDPLANSDVVVAEKSEQHTVAPSDILNGLVWRESKEDHPVFDEALSLARNLEDVEQDYRIALKYEADTKARYDAAKIEYEDAESDYLVEQFIEADVDDTHLLHGVAASSPKFRIIKDKIVRDWQVTDGQSFWLNMEGKRKTHEDAKAKLSRAESAWRGVRAKADIYAALVNKL